MSTYQDLAALVVQLQAVASRVRTQESTIAQLEAEIQRLKGQQPKPQEPSPQPDPQQPEQPQQPDFHVSAAIQLMAQLHNEARATQGPAGSNLRPLVLEKALCDLAYASAKAQAELRQLTHAPRGKDLSTRLREAGFSGYWAKGENVAYNYGARETFAAWWRSAGHRTNLMQSHFTHFGLGLFEQQYNAQFTIQWWTAIFLARA